MNLTWVLDIEKFDALLLAEVVHLEPIVGTIGAINTHGLLKYCLDAIL